MTNADGQSFVEQLNWFNNSSFGVLERRNVLGRNHAFRFATFDEIKQINVEKIWNALIKKRWHIGSVTIGQTLKVTEPPEYPFEKITEDMNTERSDADTFSVEIEQKSFKRQCIRSDDGNNNDLFGDIDDDIFNQIDLTGLVNPKLPNVNAQSRMNMKIANVPPQYGYKSCNGEIETMHELRMALRGKSKTAKYKVFAEQCSIIKKALKANPSIPATIKTKIGKSLQGKVNKIKQSIPNLYDAMETFIKCKQNNDFSCYEDDDKHKKTKQEVPSIQSNDVFNMSGLDLFNDIDDAMFAQIDF